MGQGYTSSFVNVEKLFSLPFRQIIVSSIIMHYYPQIWNSLMQRTTWLKYCWLGRPEKNMFTLTRTTKILVTDSNGKIQSSKIFEDKTYLIFSHKAKKDLYTLFFCQVTVTMTVYLLAYPRGIEPWLRFVTCSLICWKVIYRWCCFAKTVE